MFQQYHLVHSGQKYQNIDLKLYESKYQKDFNDESLVLIAVFIGKHYRW